MACELEDGDDKKRKPTLLGLSPRRLLVRLVGRAGFEPATYRL